MGGGACESVQNQFLPFRSERTPVFLVIRRRLSRNNSIFLSAYIFYTFTVHNSQRAVEGRDIGSPVGGRGWREREKKEEKKSEGELVVCRPKRLPTQRGSFGLVIFQSVLEPVHLCES